MRVLVVLSSPLMLPLASTRNRTRARESLAGREVLDPLGPAVLEDAELLRLQVGDRPALACRPPWPRARPGRVRAAKRGTWASRAPSEQRGQGQEQPGKTRRRGTRPRAIRMLS